MQFSAILTPLALAACVFLPSFSPVHAQVADEYIADVKWALGGVGAGAAKVEPRYS